ncbi:hypothetical protein YC2023_002691 [Brassica napus]
MTMSSIVSGGWSDEPELSKEIFGKLFEGEDGSGGNIDQSLEWVFFQVFGEDLAVCRVMFLWFHVYLCKEHMSFVCCPTNRNCRRKDLANCSKVWMDLEGILVNHFNGCSSKYSTKTWQYVTMLMRASWIEAMTMSSIVLGGWSDEPELSKERFGKLFEGADGFGGNIGQPLERVFFQVFGEDLACLHSISGLEHQSFEGGVGFYHLCPSTRGLVSQRWRGGLMGRHFIRVVTSSFVARSLEFPLFVILADGFARVCTLSGGMGREVVRSLSTPIPLLES